MQSLVKDGSNVPIIAKDTSNKMASAPPTMVDLQ